MIILAKNKYKTLLIICMLTCSFVSPVFSQIYYSENIDNNKYFISLNSELTFNSNTLTNKFAGAFYNGQFLDLSLKTSALEDLYTKNNLLAYLFNTDLYLNIPGKKHDINFYAGFENHNLMECRFNRNLFHLVFFGNKDFANKFMVLENLSLNYLNFQQIKAGIVKTWFTKQTRHTLIAGLGFNNGQSLLKYELPYGTLFSQKDGEFLNLDLDISMKRSDTLQSKFGSENGSGASVDLSYIFQDEKNLFEFQLEDLGFIRWNKHSQSYHKDTIVYFDGINVSNLLDINGNTISGLGADSILNAFAYSKSTKAFSEMIPMKTHICYKRYMFNRRLSLSISFTHYFFSLYKPLLRFVPSVNIPFRNSIISVAPSIEVGGYGRFNCGLGISTSINKKFYIELQTGYINAYVNPKKSAGLGGFISIIKTL